jgi:hypothetical protein
LSNDKETNPVRGLIEADTENGELISTARLIIVASIRLCSNVERDIRDLKPKLLSSLSHQVIMLPAIFSVTNVSILSTSNPKNSISERDKISSKILPIISDNALGRGAVVENSNFSFNEEMIKVNGPSFVAAVFQKFIDKEDEVGREICRLVHLVLERYSDWAASISN